MMTAALLAATLFPSYAWLVLTMAVFGAGYAASTPAGGRAVLVWFDRDRGFAMGIRQTGVPVGGLVGALTLPAVAHAAGYRAAFVFAAVLVLVPTIIAYCRLPREPRRGGAAADAGLAGARHARPGPRPAPDRDHPDLHDPGQRAAGDERLRDLDGGGAGGHLGRRGGAGLRAGPGRRGGGAAVLGLRQRPHLPRPPGAVRAHLRAGRGGLRHARLARPRRAAGAVLRGGAAGLLGLGLERADGRRDGRGRRHRARRQRPRAWP